MPLKSILWILVSLVFLFYSFKHPFYALLFSMFEYFTHPQFRWWGRALPDINYAYIISIICLISFAIHYKRLKYDVPWKKKSSLPVLILFWVNMIFVWKFHSINMLRTKQALIDFFELIIFYFIFLNTLTDKKKINYVLLFLILGHFFFSYEAWGKHLTHGRLEGVGGVDSRNSNHLAMNIVAVTPLLGTYYLYGSKYEKIISIISAPFILNTMILCNSRGGFLGLLFSVVIYLFYCTKKDLKKIIPVLLIGAILFMYLTDERFWNRMKTLETYHQERSAVSRLHYWKGALKMSKDYPFGGGFKAFVEVGQFYTPWLVEVEHRKKNVHNTILYTLTSWGYMGAFLFIIFIFQNYTYLIKARKIARMFNDKKFEYLSIALISGFSGFWLSAMFGVREQSVLLYWLSATSAAMYNVLRNQLTNTSKSNVT